jgi:hypothetical protein
MLASLLQGLRSRYVELISSATHLVILVIAVQINTPEAWVFCLGLIALVSLFAWAANFRRMRLIADTPTSRIGSAAQGYVELFGRAVLSPENLLVSPLGSMRCIWFRYWVYSKTHDRKWACVNQGLSQQTFEIEDSTGRCIVDPDHAEVIGADRRVTYPDRNTRHVEELLFGNAVYALGAFSTIGGAASPLNLKEDVSLLLTEWKRDRATLLKRFDLDGNGEIDLEEWELARKAAQREVEREHREIRAQSGTHVMRAPKDGRLFLLSSLSPKKLKNRYLLWSLVHLAILLLAVGVVIWIYQV